jgi:deazaflavin-dependent oxidoreductase (nitroreductase family)
MTLSDTLADVRLKTMNAVHKSLLAASGGRLGKSIGKMPMVKVSTHGRHSGKARTVMLATPIQDGDSYILVASKGGDDRDPDWYRNLVANPEITLEPLASGSGGPQQMVARTASSQERSELWPRIVAAYKGYGSYQNKTDREIPVVVVQPPPS